MTFTVAEPGTGYERRAFLGVALAGTVGWGIFEWRSRRETALAMSRLPLTVTIVEFDAAGHHGPPVSVSAVIRSDAEWKKRLAVDQYMMTRRADTELAFTGEFWNFGGDGLYRCVCCGTALFDSRAKFSSGTGWPSFFEPIAAENVAQSADSSFGMARTAASCRRCGAHLGHVFDDGPPPTNLRYCVNSVALRFVSRTI